jgi:hypothetical protein
MEFDGPGRGLQNRRDLLGGFALFYQDGDLGFLERQREVVFDQVADEGRGAPGCRRPGRGRQAQRPGTRIGRVIENPVRFG